MKIVKIFAYLIINLIRLFRLTELYQPTYNPKKYHFIRSNFSERECDDRISAIKSNIDFINIDSYLDIGSQLGYFVFKLSETNRNMFACGIEMNAVSYSYSTNLLLLNNLSNICFGRMKISKDNISQIANYDVISFLNVFHHILFFEGFESANMLMHELYKKCNKYFIFETGQYDEKGYYWSDKLNFMGKDPIKWINDYLLSLNYSEVKLIGEFYTHLSNNRRGLFLCIK